jgi:hypothetical protein
VVIVSTENFMVATGYGTYDIAYTYEGSNWFGATSNIFTGNNNISGQGYAWGVGWNGTMWVATGNGSNTLAYSSDGRTWTGVASSPFPDYAWSVAWNGNVWVATGGSDGTAECSIAYSYDGMNWTAADTSSSLIFSYGGFGVAWGGSYWVAVGGGSNMFATSYDGINWTAQPSNAIFGDAGVQAIAYNGNLWVATGNQGVSTIAYSLDGINWAGVDASSFTFQSWGNTVAWNGSIWVAGGTSASGLCLAYSYDAFNWTLSPSQTFNFDCWSVAWNGLQWTAVGDSNATIARSTNGVNWTSISSALFTDGYAVAARRPLYRTTTPFAGGEPGSILYTTSTGTVAGAAGFTYNTLSGVTLSGDFLPATSNVHDLGSASKPWHHLYVGGSTIFLGDVAITSASGTVTFTNASGAQVSPVGATGPTGVQGPPGTVAGSDTQIVFNQSGSPGASSNLTFTYSSGLMTVSAARITNNLVVLGTISGGTTTVSTLNVGNATTISGLATLSSAIISNNLSLAIVNGAAYPQTFGTLGQSLTISSAARTLYWTTPPSASFGNVIRVDSVYGNDTYGAIGTYPFLTVGAAISAASTGMHILITAGTYNLSYGITIPTGVSLRGSSTQTTTLQMLNVTADTTLITMGTNTRVEDLTMKLTSQEHHTLKGMVFGGDTSATAKLRTCVLTVNNASAGAAGGSTVTGVECSGTGTLGSASFSFNSLKGATINVYSDGSGNKRGILVNNTNIVTTRDLNVYVAAPATPNTATGSYVGVETADAANTGSIQMRTTTIGTVAAVGGNTYTSSDILQTNPATVIDPTYLASAGIQLGPGVDLVTKSAGGLPFTTYVYPTTIFYCARGTVTGTKTGYLWPGTQLFAGGGSSVPDTTTPVARYRIQQPIIVSGLMISCATGPGAGSNAVVTVCKNASTGGALSGATSITATLSGTAASTESYYNSSVNFAAGDFLCVYVDIQGNALTDLVVQVDCF